VARPDSDADRDDPDALRLDCGATFDTSKPFHTVISRGNTGQRSAKAEAADGDAA
jgi:hypothetical protein